MPLAVSLCVARISQVVLLAQLVSDARRRRPQSLRAADDLRPSTGVVGDLTKRVRIHAIARRTRPATTASTTATTRNRRQTRPRPAPSWEWKWHRHRKRRTHDVNPSPGPVDTERVDEHFALAYLLSQGTYRYRAVGVVTIRNDEQRLLLMCASLGCRNGRRHGVVDRGAAGWRSVAHGAADQATVCGPALFECGSRG